MHLQRTEHIRKPRHYDRFFGANLSLVIGLYMVIRRLTLVIVWCDGRSKAQQRRSNGSSDNERNERISQILCYLHVTQTFSYARSARARAQGLSAGQKVETPLHDMTWSNMKGN